MHIYLRYVMGFYKHLSGAVVKYIHVGVLKETMGIVVKLINSKYVCYHEKKKKILV